MKITEPTVTDNARFVAGILTGTLNHSGAADMYRAIHADPKSATITVENLDNGNTYRVTVEQIGGVE